MRAAPLQPIATFTQELEDLAAGHIALWLAGVLPMGPALLWRGGRHLAGVLAQHMMRDVILLEPEEGATAEAIRHGTPGVRVVHAPLAKDTPDLSDLGMQGFRTLVMRPEPGELPALLTALLPLTTDDSAVCIVTTPPEGAAHADALAAVGRPAIVLRQLVTASSFISVTDADAEVTVDHLGEEPPRVHARRELVLAGAEHCSLRSSVLLGEEHGVESWRAGIDQMVETVTALDRLVLREHAMRVDTLEAELAVAEQRRRDADQTVVALSNHIELIHRSTSWRVTRPLRWFKEMTTRA